MIKRKKTKTEDLKVDIPEPVFKIHRMPKGYKSGRFESSAFSNVTQEKKTSKGSSKKIGLIIVFLGSIFVIFLIYIIISYLSQPDFSLARIFKLNEVSESSSPSLKEEENLSSFVPKEEEKEVIIIEEEEEELIMVEEEEEEEIVIEEIEEEKIEVVVDSDGDGLGDEEELLIGTDPLMVDSDNDGHDDLTELLNLYDPLGSGLLKDNVNIKDLKEESLIYSILYPKAWDLNVSSDGYNVLLFIDDKSFIQILVEENEAQQNIASWYGSRFFSFIDASEIIEKEAWSGLYSQDGSSFFLTDQGREHVITILYNFPEKQSPEYINIFKTIVNSFQLK